MADESKRNRKANFTSSECTLILDEAEKNLDVLRNKFSTNITNQKKKMVWEEMTKKVNSIGVCTRSVNEVKDKWRAMVSSAKKIHNHLGKQRAKTGGGPKPPSPKPTDQKIIDIFGENPSFSGITGGIQTGVAVLVGYLRQLLDKLKELNYGSLATVMGRYYSMDRDKRWERIKIAYEGLVQGIGEKATVDNVIDIIKARYEAEGDKHETDEFLKPIIVDQEGIIQDGDTICFIDFRADRMRQINEALGVKPQFETSVIPKNLHHITMTEYKKEFPFPPMFPPEVPKNVLAEWLGTKKVPQYHCAETEKYAHVTFFFNGGVEAKFELEDRMLVPSPKVATYDLQPTMSCAGVADEMVKTIETGKYPFVMCNFAPPDMVGHTGKYEAAVIACNATDTAIGRIHKACQEHNYTLMVTSDHGNAEQMISEKGGPHTAHTTNRVPLVMTGGHKYRDFTHNAALCDVATTVLDVMGLDIPAEMTGQSLLQK